MSAESTDEAGVALTVVTLRRSELAWEGVQEDA